MLATWTGLGNVKSHHSPAVVAPVPKLKKQELLQMGPPGRPGTPMGRLGVS